MKSMGKFGEYGGRFVPETLMHALGELEEAFLYYRKDPNFIKDVNQLLKDYSGRPTPLYYAERLTKYLGGSKIYRKRLISQCMETSLIL